MAITTQPSPSSMFSSKHSRRTATSVMAGSFDVRPARDVLTSLLNGVGPYKVVEKEEESRRTKKKEKRERDRERKREKAAIRAQEKAAGIIAAQANVATTSAVQLPPPTPAPVPAPVPVRTASSFWRARPTIQIATLQRSVSVTPPPTMSPLLLPSTPPSTPGPSTGSTSRTSSKRPRTPDDDEDIDARDPEASHPRRKRVAVKKGWKGWVEGSPPPSEKLINLDAVPVLQERRTRSGKNFDAIGVGKDGWV